MGPTSRRDMGRGVGIKAQNHRALVHVDLGPTSRRDMGRGVGIKAQNHRALVHGVDTDISIVACVYWNI